MMANRIGRLELLFWCVESVLAAGIVFSIVAIVTNIPVEPGRTPHWLQALALIAATVVMFKAQVSGFHEIGWSGRAVLLLFVPLVNVLAFLFLLVVPGQKRPNPYGEPNDISSAPAKAAVRRVSTVRRVFSLTTIQTRDGAALFAFLFSAKGAPSDPMRSLSYSTPSCKPL